MNKPNLKIKGTKGIPTTSNKAKRASFSMDKGKTSKKKMTYAKAHKSVFGI